MWMELYLKIGVSEGDSVGAGDVVIVIAPDS